MATWLAEDMLNGDPLHQNLINGKKSRTIERWAKDIEKIHRIDGRPWNVIDHVLKWARADIFWKKNIQSGEKFREKFSRLYGESGGRDTTESEKGNLTLPKSRYNGKSKNQEFYDFFEAEMARSEEDRVESLNIATCPGGTYQARGNVYK